MRKHILCLFAVLLMVFPLCICCGETADIQQADVNVTLVSYDVLNRYENMYSSDMGIWLRYRMEYDEERFSIEDMEMLYYGPKENVIDYINTLSASDPDIFDCRFGCMWLKWDADDSYIMDLIRDGHITARILLRDRVSGEELTVECDVDSENAIMGTDYNPDAYRIEVNQYECEKIEEPDSCYRLYPGLEEYVESHPGIECYKITFFGKEYMSAAGKAILFPKFTSSSDGLFLYREGGIFETAGEASDAYDLIIEGQKDICFRGVICAENSDSLQDRIRKAEMSIAFSNEFAGTFDMSDAGDRFSGPKKVILPIIVSDDLTRKQ